MDALCQTTREMGVPQDRRLLMLRLYLNILRFNEERPEDLLELKRRFNFECEEAGRETGAFNHFMFDIIERADRSDQLRPAFEEAVYDLARTLDEINIPQKQGRLMINLYFAILLFDKGGQEVVNCKRRFNSECEKIGGAERILDRFMFKITEMSDPDDQPRPRFELAVEDLACAIEVRTGTRNAATSSSNTSQSSPTEPEVSWRPLPEEWVSAPPSPLPWNISRGRITRYGPVSSSLPAPRRSRSPSSQPTTRTTTSVVLLCEVEPDEIQPAKGIIGTHDLDTVTEEEARMHALATAVGSSGCLQKHGGEVWMTTHQTIIEVERIHRRRGNPRPDPMSLQALKLQYNGFCDCCLREFDASKFAVDTDQARTKVVIDAGWRPPPPPLDHWVTVSTQPDCWKTVSPPRLSEDSAEDESSFPGSPPLAPDQFHNNVDTSYLSGQWMFWSRINRLRYVGVLKRSEEYSCCDVPKIFFLVLYSEVQTCMLTPLHSTCPDESQLRKIFSCTMTILLRNWSFRQVPTFSVKTTVICPTVALPGYHIHQMILSENQWISPDWQNQYGMRLHSDLSSHKRSDEEDVFFGGRCLHILQKVRNHYIRARSIRASCTSRKELLYILLVVDLLTNVCEYRQSRRLDVVLPGTRPRLSRILTTQAKPRKFGVTPMSDSIFMTHYPLRPQAAIAVEVIISSAKYRRKRSCRIQHMTVNLGEWFKASSLRLVNCTPSQKQIIQSTTGKNHENTASVKDHEEDSTDA
jgi:hypothetical protein